MQALRLSTYTLLCLMLLPLNAYAQIISTVQNFSFGDFALLDFINVEQIEIAENGNVTNTSDILFLTDPQRGIYAISGGPAFTTYTVNLPTEDIILPGTLGTSLVIDNLAAGPTTKGTDVNGDAQFWLYGRLQTRGNMSYEDQTLSSNIEIEVVFDN